MRVEELYPFPREPLAEVLERYAGLRELVWAQEEPQNMGAWTFMEPRLRALAPDGVRLAYVGRPERAAPAEGYGSAQAVEQARIVGAAFAPLGGGAPAPRKRTPQKRR